MSAAVAFVAGTIVVVGPPASVLAVGPVATTTVSAPLVAPLLGESSTFAVTFDNTDATAVGYAPFIDIRINASGADGAGAAKDDGFVGVTMSLLGSPIAAVVPDGTPCGGVPVTHPLTNLPVPCASGIRLFVFRLPFGSFTPNQPVALLDTAVTMSNLADVDFALSLSALPGFAFGSSPTGSTVILGAERTASTAPRIARITKSYEGVEDETATGPNFAQRYLVSADLPTSVVFSSVRINDALPGTHQFNSVTSVTPTPSSTGNPSTIVPGGTMTRQWGPITGGAGASDVSVGYSFFVPRRAGSGAAIVDPATGDDVSTINDSWLTVTYAPADLRDPIATTTVNSNTTDNHTLTVKSIAVQETSRISVNIGSPGFNAGDTLAYTITGQVSDFFSLGSMVVTDVLGDGQTFVDGSATFTVTSEGMTTGAAVVAADLTIDTTARTTCGAGTTKITLRLSDAFVTAGADATLVGGLVHTVPDNGAASFEVKFEALVSDAYACSAADLSIDEGDRVDNNVSVTAELFDESGVSIGANEVDISTTSRGVDTTPVTTTPYAKNGVVDVFATMTAGDLVTYRIRTSSPSSDFEALTLTDFLPSPILTVGGFSTLDVTTTCTTPSLNAACYGPLDTLHAQGAAPDPVVTRDTVSNSITVDYGTYDDPANQPADIDLLFTVRVTDSPFRDGLILTNQVVKSHKSSFGVANTATSVVQLVLDEPLLDIANGVAGASNLNATGLTIASTRNPTGVVWFEPGPAAAAPGFSGTVTTAGLVGLAPNANVAKVDAADLVRFAVVVENTGSGANGAFDVAIKVTFTDGFIVPSAGIRLLVTDGAGTALANTATGAFSAAPGTGGNQTGTVVLTDGPPGALAPGRTGGVTNAVGTNIAVITYELEVAATAVPNTIHTDAATLAAFAATEGGPTFIGAVPTASQTNPATVTTAPTGIAKVVGTSNQDFTTGSRLAIGEVVTYEVALTIPEGTSQSLTLTDVLDIGQAFVSVDSITADPALTSSTGFPAVLLDARALASPGRTASFHFGAVTNGDRDNTVAETIMVVYRAIVLNVGTNTLDVSRDNQATVSYTGNVAGSVDQAAVTIVEPMLVTHKSATPTIADANDVVTFVIDVRHTGQPSDADAFDVSTVDVIPSGMTYVAESLDTAAVAADVPLTLEIVGSVITARWTGIAVTPFEFGQIRYQATLDSDTTAPAVMTNTATTTWTSLPGEPMTTSSFNTNDTERTGADGPGGLNDFRDSASASISVANPELVKTLVATTDPHTAGNGLTIGEVGTYQVLVTMPEGANGGFQVGDVLPDGLRLTGMPSVIIGSAESSGQLTNDFAGNLGLQTFSTSTVGTIDTLTLDVGPTTVTSDNDLTNNSFLVRFAAVVADVPGNVGDSASTVLDNTASVRLTGGPIVASNAVAVDIVEPRLDVVKTFTPNAASPGSTVLVTIAVGNVGLTDGFDSVVTDMLDAQLDPMSVLPATVPGWTFVQTGAALRWTADPGIAAHAGTTVTFAFTVALLASDVAGATIANTASAITTTGEGVVAGERVEPVSQGTAILGVAEADLNVTISDGVTTAVPGTTLDYVVVTTNTGGAPAANVVLTNTLPTGTTFVGVAGPCVSSSLSTATTMIFTLGSMAIGASASCSIKVGIDVPALAGTTSYLAAVTAATDGSAGADPTPANNSSVDNDTIIAHPAVSVTKNDGVASLGAGAASSYVVTVANTGDIGTTNVLITDTLPAGFVFIGCANGTGSFAAACAVSGGVVSTTLTTLAGGGATATLTISGTVVTPAPAALETLVNTVHVVDDGVNGVDPDTADNTAADTDVIDAAPDLVISKTTTEVAVQPGGSLTYAITVTNTGTQDATGVTVADRLPIGLSATCGTETPLATTCDATGYTWTEAMLPVGASLQYSLAASVAAAMPAGSHVVSNTAVVVDDGSNGPDPTPENNTATAEVGLVGYFVDLAVTKTDGVVLTTPGTTLTYTISVTNEGNIGASGVSVVDVVPSGATFVAAPDTGHGVGVHVAGAVTWQLATVAGGTTSMLTVLITVDAPVAAGREGLVNQVSVGDDGFSGADTVLGNNTASDRDTLSAAPDLVVTKTDGVMTVQPGGALAYVITVANVGNQATVDVALTDALPDGTMFIAASDGGAVTAGIVTWPAFDLPAGSSRTFTVTVLVEGQIAAGMDSIVNAATATDHATSGTEPNLTDNTGSDTDLVVAVPDLLITQSDGVAVTTPGSNLTYRVVVSNVGEQGATGVVADDTIPLGTTFVSAVDLGPGATAFAAGHVVWDVGSVPAGVARLLDVTVHVTSPAVSGRDELSNTTAVADDGSNGPDSAPADNSATDTDTLDAAPDLVVTKTDGVLVAMAGHIIVYAITVANVGTQDAIGVLVTDAVPDGTLLITAPGSTMTVDRIAWPAFDLASGASSHFTVSVVVVDPVDAARETVINRATATDDASNGADQSALDNVGLDTDTLSATPDLVLTATDGAATIEPGDETTYTLTVTNTGEQGATGVALSDTVPAGATFVSASAGGVAIGNQVTWPEFGLAAAAAATYTVTVAVDSPASAGRTTIVNGAAVVDDGTSGFDPTPGDNTATDTDTLIADPSVAITISDGVIETSPGATLTYVLTISNAGNQSALVQVTDALPVGVTFVDAPSVTVVGAGRSVESDVTWSAFGLTAGETVAVTVLVTVDASAPPGVERLINTAVAADVGNGSPSPAPAVDTDALTAVPDLVVTKTDARNDVSPGETLIYMVTVTNIGDQDATGVRVTDSLPPGLEFVSATDLGGVSADGVTWPAVSIAGGSTVVYAVTVVVANPPVPSISQLDNVAVVANDGAGGAEPNLADNIATDRDLIDSTIDLAITNSNGTATSTPGTWSTWQLTVSNLGHSPVGHFSLAVVLPHQLSNVSYRASVGTYDRATEVWSGPAVTGGGTVTIALTGLIAEDANGTLTNEATVAPLDGLLDRAPGDNHAIDIDGFVEAPVVVGWIPTAGTDVVHLILAAMTLLGCGVMLLMATRGRENGQPRDRWKR